MTVVEREQVKKLRKIRSVCEDNVRNETDEDGTLYGRWRKEVK